MIIIPAIQQFLVTALIGLPGRRETNRLLFIKIDHVIVTQVGFCVISRWPLTGFF